MDIETIKDTIRNHDNYNIDDSLKNISRKREYVESRFIYFKMCQELKKMGLSDIARSIHPKKNHATVLHGIKTINNLMKIDKEYRLRYETLRARAKYYQEIREKNKALSFEDCLVRIADLETQLKEVKKENIYFLNENCEMRELLKEIKLELNNYRNYLNKRGFDTHNMKVFNLLKYR